MSEPGTEAQAVALLNEAKLETDGAAKVGKLRGVYELVVNKQPELLEEFLPEMAELQVDPSPHVRKYLPEFLAGAAQARPTAAVLQPCTQCVAQLLGDSVPAAAKQAVLTANLLFRSALLLVAAKGGDAAQAGELRAVWEGAEGLKAAVTFLAAQHKNDGVRLNAAKFIEQAVLLLTADSLPAPAAIHPGPVQVQAGNQVVTKSALVKDAEGLLAQLVALLKLRLGDDVSGPVAIVLVKGAGTIMQQRPQFLGRLLPPLLALANSGAFKVDATESGSASSIANALKGTLVGVLRCADPKAVTWRKKVVDALHAIGAGALADSALRQVNRGSKRSSSEETEGAKRARLAGPQQQNPAQQPQPAAFPHTQQPQQPLPPHPAAASAQQPGPPTFAEAVPQPPPTSEADLQRVLTVVRALVGSRDANTLAAIVGGLQPAVLADVVLALLQALPPRQALPPDHHPQEPWVLTLLQLLAPQSQLPAGHMQPAARAATPPIAQQPFVPPQQPYQQLAPTLQQAGAHEPQPMQQPAPMPAGLAYEPHPVQAPAPAAPAGAPGLQAPAAGAAVAPGVGPPTQQQQQPPGVLPPPKQGADGPAAAPKAAARPPPPVPAFHLAPLPLTQQQQADLRRAAVLRILGSRQVASPALQRALVVKLASSASAELGDAVLQFLLEDFAGRGGFELCMQWLSSLFAKDCRPLGAPGTGGVPTGADADSLAEFINSGLDSFGMEGFLGVKAEEPQRSPGGGGGGGNGGEPAAEARPGSAASDGGGAAPGTDGHAVGQYQVVLLALLEGLKERLPASDRTIIRVLLEVPALPMPAVRNFLREMCASGPDWVTLALLAAKDIIDQRPPSREQVLGFVLEAAGDATADVRTKAVRLTANRLFPQPSITAAIERHARQQLDSMVAPAPSRPSSAAAAGQPGSSPGPGAPAAPAARETPSSDREATPPSGQADAARPLVSDAAKAQAEQSGEQQQQKQQPGATGSQETAGEPAPAASGGPDEAQAAQLCALYCALCTKKHSLLRHLFEVFAQTSDGGRAAIHRNAPGLAKTLGATAPALLAVVADPPEGSLNLVVNMVYVLTEAAPPPPALVAVGLQLFERCRDPRVLPPLLPAMEKAAVLRLLPAVLELPPEALKEALRRLVTPQPGAPRGEAPLLAPSELLVALHTLDTSADPGLLRRVMAAVTACINSRDLFGHEALAAAISQLLTLARLPQLFMRTVIQSLGADRRLRPFVCRTLAQLVQRRVWEDATQWKGWVMAAQQAAPESFPAWLLLPTRELERTLAGLPQPFKQQLAAHAAGAQGVPRPTLDLLQPFLPKAEGA